MRQHTVACMPARLPLHPCQGAPTGFATSIGPEPGSFPVSGGGIWNVFSSPSQKEGASMNQVVWGLIEVAVGVVVLLTGVMLLVTA